MEATEKFNNSNTSIREKQLYLGLGSNVGDRASFLNQACTRLQKQIGPILRSSSIYETSAWGKTDQDAFLNQVIVIKTTRTPHENLAICQAIENELFRHRATHWGPRTIDIDLLYLDQLVMKDEQLTLPHPWIASRRFVLAPLAEVAPDFLHPVHQMSSRDMLDLCPDPLLIKIWEGREVR